MVESGKRRVEHAAHATHDRVADASKTEIAMAGAGLLLGAAAAYKHRDAIKEGGKDLKARVTGGGSGHKDGHASESRGRRRSRGREEYRTDRE